MPYTMVLFEWTETLVNSSAVFMYLILVINLYAVIHVSHIGLKHITRNFWTYANYIRIPSVPIIVSCIAPYVPASLPWLTGNLQSLQNLQTRPVYDSRLFQWETTNVTNLSVNQFGVSVTACALLFMTFAILMLFVVGLGNSLSYLAGTLPSITYSAMYSLPDVAVTIFISSIVYFICSIVLCWTYSMLYETTLVVGRISRSVKHFIYIVFVFFSMLWRTCPWLLIVTILYFSMPLVSAGETDILARITRPFTSSDKIFTGGVGIQAWEKFLLFKQMFLGVITL